MKNYPTNGIPSLSRLLLISSLIASTSMTTTAAVALENQANRNLLWLLVVDGLPQEQVSPTAHREAETAKAHRG